MRIGFLTFHNDYSSNKVGGVVSGPLYMVQNLRQVIGAEVDFLVVADSTKRGKIRNKAYEEDVSSFLGFFEGTKDHESDVELLNSYDLLMFMTPGKTYEKFKEEKVGQYKKVLDKLTVPFGFIVNEERDRDMYLYYTEFTDHPGCKYILYNSEDMAKDFEDFNQGGKVVAEFQFMTPLEPLNKILEKASNKTSSVINTGRWVNRKRIVEYVELAPKFAEVGIQPYLAGAKQNPFYSKQVDEMLETQYFQDKTYQDYLTYVGAYKPTKEELDGLLDDKMFHYNFVFLRTKRKMYNRLEIATMEAFNRGCLPIVCSETSPDWVEGALSLSRDQLEEIPSIVAGISDAERIDRLTIFYKSIRDNVEAKYKDIFNNLFESLGINK
ncbi:hypothetical protein SP15_153 [Bacillus phage SP-15]|uniref:Glycosyltransferase n=1 Tax=Bacillus phage SP-15 TaxID=1792032 RepID=A0A127AYX3_9CAUD|nr:hypothetical protein SP15_153 [Bacillus phage SP-15]AMM44951.1 hypothetical protein SP15_153 [Bacillus phage SP-15]